SVVAGAGAHALGVERGAGRLDAEVAGRVSAGGVCGGHVAAADRAATDRPAAGALREVRRDVLAAGERAGAVHGAGGGGVVGGGAGLAGGCGAGDAAGGRAAVRGLGELPAAGAVELVDGDPDAVDAGERA